jgi:hypothetical protein
VGIVLILYIGIYIYVSANKKSIIKQVTQEISEKLSGEVTIGDVDLSFIRGFPNISVVLKNVSIKDSMFAKHNHPFFEGEEVFIRLGLMQLIRQKSALTGLRIERGNFYVYTDTSGYSNDYLYRSKKSAENSKGPRGRNELKNIVFEDVRIIMDDKRKKKFHDFAVTDLSAHLEDKDSTYLVFDVESDILVHSLSFNVFRGSFIKEKTFVGDFEIRYNKTLKQLQFDNIDVEISKHPFNFSGRFDLEGPAAQFSISVKTKDILYPFAKTLVTEKIAKALSIVSMDKKVDVDVNINGPLRAEPLIKISWLTKNTNLKTPFLDFQNASFGGSYTNEITAGAERNDENSRIELHNFKAEWQGLPITSNNFQILNLVNSTVICDLQSSFPLAKLNKIINTSSIRMTGGDGTININYKGPIAKNNNTNSFLNGVISFKNGLMLYAPRDVELKNVSGRVVFKSSDVFVENIQAEVLNNKIVMEGDAKNLLTLISSEPNKAVINWSIYSPSLNLASFAYLLKPRKKTLTVVKDNSNALEKSARQIDEVLEKGSVNVSLKADRLLYKKFDASNAIAYISLLNDSYIIHKVSMEHAGGHMDINGSLHTQKINYHQAKVNVNMNNVDVSKTLAAFDNFGQDGITSQSLKGKMTSEINATMGLDNDGNAYPATIEGTVDFSLKNGALINYEPIKRLQNFLLKNRDFNNIQFAELKNRLEIKNQEVKINRMEIQSSILTMFVEGIYSMKGTTDLSIQVPLSNIRGRDSSYIPKNMGTDKKVGSSIYLRGKPGKDGNVQFKLDLFNKFRKDKDEKSD